MDTTASTTMAPFGAETKAERRARLQRRALLGALLLGAIVLPFVVGDYRVFQLSLVCIYAIALLGKNLLIGFNGQFSLGHGAFFAIGAYTAAILMDQWSVPYLWTIPAAGLISGVSGFLFGIPALRIRGMYLALATLALAVAMPPILKHDAFAHYTGGVQGIFVDKPEAPFGLPLSPDDWLYFICLTVLVLGMLVARNLLVGRTGRAMMAIRDHHVAAQAMGIDTSLYKSLTFGVSALYTGVAGSLSCIVVQFVAPDSFTVFLSITFLVGSVVGGLASISGAVYGALFIQFVPNLADVISKAAPWAVYGAFLIGFMLFMPAGIAGTFHAVGARLQKRLAATRAPADAGSATGDGHTNP